MPLLKLWYDLRARALNILVLFFIITAVQVGTFPSLKSLARNQREEVAKLQSPEVERFLSDYGYYAEARWLQEADMLVVVAVLLSIGGVLTEKRLRTIFLTLSFPVPRRKWLLMQAGLVFVILLAFTLIASIVFFIGGLIFKQEFSLGHATAAALILAVVTSPWIGLTLIASSLPPYDRFYTAVTVISCMILINIASMLSPAVNSWVPKTLMTAVAYGSANIWKPLCVIFVSAALSLFFAIWRFERMDY